MDLELASAHAWIGQLVGDLPQLRVFALQPRAGSGVMLGGPQGALQTPPHDLTVAGRTIGGGCRRLRQSLPLTDLVALDIGNPAPYMVMIVSRGSCLDRSGR